MMRSARPASTRRLAEFYLDAKKFVIDSGYFAEIDRQDQSCMRQAGEQDLLREAAWVVLSSGMREQVIRRYFPAVSTAFYEWSSAARIALDGPRCVEKALCSFRHRPKIEAIARNCELVTELGADNILRRTEREGPTGLQVFDYVGEVTCWHLAKNLGLDVVKPDRHLVRMASAAGCGSPGVLCRRIAEFTGDRVAVVDIVLWRYANLVSSYARPFA